MSFRDRKESRASCAASMARGSDVDKCGHRAGERRAPCRMGHVDREGVDEIEVAMRSAGLTQVARHPGGARMHGMRFPRPHLVADGAPHARVEIQPELEREIFPVRRLAQS